MKSSLRLFIATVGAAGAAFGFNMLACSTSDAPSSGSSSRAKAGEGAVLPDGTVFTRAGLLTAFAECVTTNTRSFQSKAQSFDQATSRFAGSPSDTAALADARQAWKDAIDVWQRLEVMQVGPAASKQLPGGLEIRDTIYAWPLSARCPVEQNIVGKTYESATFAKVLVNARGLAAAEYLLFHEGTDNACSAATDINTNGSWAALAADATGADGLAARKALYAKNVATDVAQRASELADAWDPSKGNFQSQLTQAGKGSKIFTSEQLAFNSISDAMFYVESDVKDMKVAHPAGLSNCTTATCPEALESLFAGRSKEHIRNNLIGFRMLMSGCGENGAGLGFDDYLTAVGTPELARQLNDALTGAIAAVDAIEEVDLRETLTSDPASVKNLYTAIKAITDLLRSQFITVLDLEIPKRVEGDND